MCEVKQIHVIPDERRVRVLIMCFSKMGYVSAMFIIHVRTLAKLVLVSWRMACDCTS